MAADDALNCLRVATASILDCDCGCCIEQVNRELHGRTGHWCSCPDYPLGERCECTHCGWDNDLEATNG